MSFTQQEFDEFRAEALELLDVAEKSLLALDSGDPNTTFRAAFDSIFRGFHNLKGAAGMMELTRLQSHTHELESILMGFKTGTSIPKEHISLFLRGVDAARSILDGQDITFDFTVSPTHAVDTQVAQAQSALPPEAIDEFAAECDEVAERISKNLQKIEAGDHSKETLDELYRDAHSMKGSAHLFSYTKLGDLSHAMESSLEKVRNGSHLPSKPLLNGLFKSLAVVEQLVERIKHRASDEDLAAVIPMLAKALTMAADKLEPVAAAGSRPAAVAVPSTAPADPGAMTAIHSIDQPLPEIIPETAPVAADAGSNSTDSSSGSIRVPVALLDNLMTLMGEMVLVRNQVLQFSNKSEDLEFLSMSKRLNVVTSEIQGEMMKTRMQPIGNVLSKFNRVVRDLSNQLKKEIQLVLHGSETELDKSLLEAIKDPLTHIVRNSCDHGIESPTDRRKVGKAGHGTIHIRSYHEGGQVIVEVQDDGKGLHKDVLLKKAIEKGLIHQAQTGQLSEKEIFNLIFAPGFSTAAKVTNVSGRGVGMDVVRTNIEKIGGTVDLSSTPGSGTTIRIKIPLTLAIVPALIVKCGPGTFAIPQVKLEELVRVDQSASDHKIEKLHGAPVLRLRGTILPLVDMNKVLNIGGETNYKDGIINIAVVNAEQNSFGLIIDEVQDTADIVVKPLNRLLKSLQVYSGATILGNGSVALIFDVLGISKIVQLGNDKSKQRDAERERDQNLELKSESQDFLLVQVNSPSKHAMVLGYVHRLEEFKRSQLEYSGALPVIRYGSMILPLLSASELLGYGRKESKKEIISVVVVERAGAFYGVEVDAILDTLSTTAEMDHALVKQPGIFGSLNTKDELIVVMDPFELIGKAFPEKFAAVEEQNFQAQTSPTPRSVPMPVRVPPPPPQALSQTGSMTPGHSEREKMARTSGKILLAEDTVFFRRAIKTVLEKTGYDVITASNGQEALNILNRKDDQFDLIISDIEMPVLNGFQFAAALRKHPDFAQLPLLAVSSRADQKYIVDGKKAGFDSYLEKLKPAVLLDTVSELLQKKRGAA